MHTKLFFIGLFLYLVSFIMPVSVGFIGNEVYGYEVALIPFEDSDFKLIDILMLVTNIAVIITSIAYAKYGYKLVSVLSALGSCVAVYWVFQVLSQGDTHPWATLAWATGSILITVGYELKRRRSDG
jgi:hypothetical protein